jgi:sugar lactone lactonase YvrE
MCETTVEMSVKCDRSVGLLVDGLQLPECPRWRGDRLWFVDLLGRRVLTVTLDGLTRVEAELDDVPSGLGFFPDGQTVVAQKSRREVVTLSGGGRGVVIADLSVLGGDHLNDMIVSDDGTAYIDWRARRIDGFGTVAHADRGADAIVTVPLGGAPEIAATGLTYPNGLALTEDGRRLIVAEPFLRRLRGFAVGADGGLTLEASDVASFAKAMPDGICLDQEGGVWVAGVEAGFVRVDSDGNVTDSIGIGGRFAMACTLGGPDGRTLFMAIADTTWEGLGTGRSRGTIETARVAVAGAGIP